MRNIKNSESIYSLSSGKYSNLGRLLYLNIIMMINTSFGVASFSIIPEISVQIGYSSLGQSMLALNYLITGIFNMICPIYLQKVQYNYGFAINSGFNFLICLIGAYLVKYGKDCSIYLVYFICILLNLSSGVLQAGFWVGQSLYTSECSNDGNRGFFYGISNSLSNSGQMIGSLLSAFLIKPLGRYYYFLLLAILSLLTSLLYLLVPQPQGPRVRNKEQLDINKSKMIGIVGNIELQVIFRFFQSKQSVNHEFQTLNLKPISNTTFKIGIQSSLDKLNEEDLQLLEQIEQKKEHLHQTKSIYEVNEFFHDLPLNQQVKEILNIATSNRIRPLLTYMFQTGLIIGFEGGVFYLLISQAFQHDYPKASDTDLNVYTFIVFCLQGTAEVFGGLIFGIIGQEYTLSYASIIQNNLQLLILTITLLNCFILSYPICLFLGFLWYKNNINASYNQRGFADCGGQANCQSLLSEDWGDDIRVYGFYSFLQNLAGMLSLIVSISMLNQPFYSYIFLLIIVEILTNYQLQEYRRNRKVE